MAKADLCMTGRVAHSCSVLLFLIWEVSTKSAVEASGAKPRFEPVFPCWFDVPNGYDGSGLVYWPLCLFKVSWITFITFCGKC